MQTGMGYSNPPHKLSTFLIVIIWIDIVFYIIDHYWPKEMQLCSYYAIITKSVFVFRNWDVNILHCDHIPIQAPG